MTKLKITEKILNNLEYDSKSIEQQQQTNMEVRPLLAPTAMFVFAGGDLNAAAYHLNKSLRNPFSSDVITSVFVEEAVLERFLVIAGPQLPKYDKFVTEKTDYKGAKAAASRINAKVIDEPTNNSSGAFLVCDISHEHLGLTRPIGFATLHTFRTAKEAIVLFGKESFQFANIIIWNQNHSCGYELVGALSGSNFFLNCYGVSLDSLEKHALAGGNYVSMNKSYHYETFPCDGVQKCIVFPVGTIFAN